MHNGGSNWKTIILIQQPQQQEQSSSENNNNIDTPNGTSNQEELQQPLKIEFNVDQYDQKTLRTRLFYLLSLFGYTITTTINTRDNQYEEIYVF